MLIRALLLTFLLSGCAENIVVRHIEGANYATFDHPYTEKADAEVRTAAENLCRKSERVAIKSESVCTLATCVTSYQCAGKGDRVK